MTTATAIDTTNEATKPSNAELDLIAVLYKTTVTTDCTRPSWQQHVQVTEQGGKRYLWATDGHRLHARETDLPTGAYAKDGARLPAKCAVPQHNILRHVSPKFAGGNVRTPKSTKLPFGRAEIRALLTLADMRHNVNVRLDGKYTVSRILSGAEEKRLSKTGALHAARALCPTGHVCESTMSEIDARDLPAVNAEYLSEAVTWAGNAVGATTVHHSGPCDPLVFSSKDKTFFAVVMPVRQ